MHPALSIIVFTTASGLGYGLAVMLGLGLLDPAAPATRIAHVAALGLIAIGLSSSVLHLRNPQRAWRALSQWRSSWLSREGVMALMTFVPLVVNAGAVVLLGRSLPLVGLLGSVLSLLTIYCTAMLYTSLRSVHAWATWLTPVCYLLFSLAGGSLAMLAAAAAGGQAVRPIALVSVVLLALAWISKLAWRRHMLAEPGPSSPETATGLGAIGRVRLFERPHTMDNYLTREMGYRVARKHAAKLWRIALLAGGVIPILLAILTVLPASTGAVVAILGVLALVIHAIGMLVERWLFFAEARHAVMNYY